MQVNLIAPCPKKPSSTSRSYNYNWFYDHQEDSINIEDVKDACLELQQILQLNSNTVTENTYNIHRTMNPLVNDTSFIIIPLQQAMVSQLHVSSSTSSTSSTSSSSTKRSRSYSLGETRNQYVIQPNISTNTSCKPVY